MQERKLALATSSVRSLTQRNTSGAWSSMICALQPPTPRRAREALRLAYHGPHNVVEGARAAHACEHDESLVSGNMYGCNTDITHIVQDLDLAR
jgi:hypothetical protein